jgi:hypothetical protein
VAGVVLALPAAAGAAAIVLLERRRRTAEPPAARLSAIDGSVEAAPRGTRRR